MGQLLVEGHALHDHAVLKTCSIAGFNSSMLGHIPVCVLGNTVGQGAVPIKNWYIGFNPMTGRSLSPKSPISAKFMVSSILFLLN